MMNNIETAEEEAADRCCASCGRAEIDEVQLRDCEKCDLARYCSGGCQQDHREKHEAICKERAAELRDELLFRQSDCTHLGDCPICFLPLPLDIDKSGMYSCCGKVICRGCIHTNKIRETEQRLKRKCPFCRKPIPKTDKEWDKRLMERAEANDPNSLREMGSMHFKVPDFDNALKYLTRAADFGDAMAHNDLADMYRVGKGVEKDEKRTVYHCEEAAIAGHPSARHNLGVYENNRNRVDRAVKHFIIAANLGHDKSMDKLKVCYKNGDVSKDDLAAALRAHHAAVEATKSPQREAAARYYGQMKM